MHLDRTRSIRHWTRRIGHVTVESIRAGTRLLKRQLFVRLKIQMPLGHVPLRRPLIVLDPRIDARSEGHRLRTFGSSLSFQVIIEERNEDVLSVIGRGWTAEVDAAEFTAVTSRPATVVPWTNHEEILFRSVVSFEQLVNFQRTVEVFLIPPARNVQRRYGHTVQPRRKRLPRSEERRVGKECRSRW